MNDFFPVVPVATPYDGRLAWWKDCFTEEELIKVGRYLDTLPLSQALTMNRTDPESEALKAVRRCQLAWVAVNDESRWIYEYLGNTVTKVNREFFGYDLSGMFQLQYTVYNEGELGAYDWHVDSQGKGAVQRKLSFSMQLSKPQDYEGGELWVWNHRQAVLAKDYGSIHFFPSYSLHRVTPVTKGTRKSLVGWVVGPEFR